MHHFAISCRLQAVVAAAITDDSQHVTSRLLRINHSQIQLEVRRANARINRISLFSEGFSYLAYNHCLARRSISCLCERVYTMLREFQETFQPENALRLCASFINLFGAQGGKFGYRLSLEAAKITKRADSRRRISPIFSLCAYTRENIKV